MKKSSIAIIFLVSSIHFANTQTLFSYKDASLSIHQRVDDLLKRMTLKEKVAQVTAVSIRKSAAIEEGIVVMETSLINRLRNGIGQIENTGDPRTPLESVEVVNALQKYLRDSTRLGIPALVGSECLHGNQAYQSTVFPTPLAMASSWNPQLVERAFDVAGKEARARGAHEAHTPVLDMGRDPRWGRIEETYGEDTYLVSQMAIAAVSGLQGGRSGNPGRTHIISSPKHFAGYAQGAGGRNFAPTEIEPKVFRDEILPPFEAAVQVANAQGMMASHSEVGGIPAHGNQWLLTDLLKKEWGFQGMIVSDYNDIGRLEEFHHVVATMEDAAKMGLIAGMDMDLPVGWAFRRLEKVISEEPSLMAYLDESVRRVLRLKFMLGLFENPFADPKVAEELVGQESHFQLAEELACESVTLLKNGGNVLPLDKNKLTQIAVIGPKATSRDLGTYSPKSDHVVTILDGIKEYAGNEVEIEYQEGCKLAKFSRKDREVIFEEYTLAEELASIEKAVELAKKSEIAIVCVGGTIATSKEAYYAQGAKGDRVDIDLVGNQKELVMRIIETGTPVVVVLMGGKPYAIPEIAKKADAILNTFYLGQTNGTALAKILFGEVNPSGKLPISVAQHVGQLPIYYSQKSTAFFKDYLEMKTQPLFPFGFGLSYTQFEYSNPRIEKQKLSLGEKVAIKFTVKNTGNRAGKEVAQLYFHDKVASITRPAKQLIRFKKVFLKPGETKEIQFELDPKKDLSFTGIEMKKVVEAGIFELMIGGNSVDVQKVEFELVDNEN